MHIRCVVSEVAPEGQCGTRVVSTPGEAQLCPLPRIQQHENAAPFRILLLCRAFKMAATSLCAVSGPRFSSARRFPCIPGTSSPVTQQRCDCLAECELKQVCSLVDAVHSVVNTAELVHPVQPLTMMPCTCLLYTSPSPRDRQKSRMPSSA